MPAADDSFARLRAAIDELAEREAADVLTDARAEALVRVRTMLSDAITDAMLDHVQRQFELPARGETADREPSRALESPPAPEPRSAPTDPPPVESNVELAWYVYGVVGAEQSSGFDELAGVDPSYPLITLPEEGLAGVASQVPLAEFGESELRAHLADMDWVERTARAHEQALDDLRQRGTVIPMRMCTVYRTEGGVREMLRREADALEKALSHLEGRTEWGVKVFLMPGSKPTATTDEGSGQGSGQTADDDQAGVAYLERIRGEREQAQHAEHLIEQACARIHERLCAVSADGLVAPPQRPEVSGHGGEMILNGVYLVDDTAEEEFYAEVRALQDELESLGLQLEATGPWPAYNFVPGTIGAAW